jgi:hypothetical protein
MASHRLLTPAFSYAVKKHVSRDRSFFSSIPPLASIPACLCALHILCNWIRANRTPTDAKELIEMPYTNDLTAAKSANLQDRTYFMEVRYEPQ